VRALFDGAGLKLSRVMLVKWGPVALPRDLPRGRSRELAGEDLDSLLALAGRTNPREKAAARKGRSRKPVRARSAGRPTGRRNGDQ